MSDQATILLVDDDATLRDALVPLLRSRGYAVECAADGREALGLMDEGVPDLVILDLCLPDIDGLDVCSRMRERWATPIIVLSARHAERQKIEALDRGADDYVTKPFGVEELLARIRVALRRADADRASRQIVHGDLRIDFDRHRVYRQNEEIRLTPKEFDLLALMAARAGRVLTHRMLLKTIWGRAAVGEPEHLRVLIAQLRKKIEPDPNHPRYLITEPWVGYRLAD